MKFLVVFVLVVVVTGASPCSDDFIHRRNPYPWIEKQVLKYCQEAATNKSSCFAVDYWVKYYGQHFPYPPPWAKSASQEWCLLVGKVMPLSDPFHSETVSVIAPLLVASPTALPWSPQETFKQLNQLVSAQSPRGFKEKAFVSSVDLFCTRNSDEECFTWKTNVREDKLNIRRLVVRWERLVEENAWSYDPWNPESAWSHASHLFDGKTLTTWSLGESISFVGSVFIYYIFIPFCIIAIVGIVLYSCGNAILLGMALALIFSLKSDSR